MAIEMRAEVMGMTDEQWEGFTTHVLPQIKTFPGFLTHASGPIEGGHYVGEVWESQESHEKWLREVIVPAMQQAGASQIPQVHYRPVDTVITR